MLRDPDYRIKLWPIDDPVSKAINEYTAAINELFKRLMVSAVDKLFAEITADLDVKLRGDLNQRFKAASTPLKTALKETADLMSELNGIKVIKMIDQRVPVEEA